MNFRVTVRIDSWWHAGAGESGVADLDAVVVRDDLGLPYLPGKTLKGLFRDAALLITRAQEGLLNEDQRVWLFGPALPPGENRREGESRMEGALRITSARMCRDFRAWASDEGNRRCLSGLFETLASTAIEDGVAKRHSLRKIEATLPMDLEAEVEVVGEPPGGLDVAGVMSRCAGLIRRLGSHRHRGLGRCRIEVAPSAEEVG